jgi:hypothetical protein
MQGPAKTFIRDIFSTQKAKTRGYINYQSIVDQIEIEPKYSRKIWGFLNLEMWNQEFIDKSNEFHALAPN